MVLANIKRYQIEEAMQNLHIINMQATKEQIDILKKSRAISFTMSNCELITKSNAERLISIFLNNELLIMNSENRQNLEGIDVSKINIFTYIDLGMKNFNLISKLFNNTNIILHLIENYE